MNPFAGIAFVFTILFQAYEKDPVLFFESAYRGSIPAGTGFGCIAGFVHFAAGFGQAQGLLVVAVQPGG